MHETDQVAVKTKVLKHGKILVTLKFRVQFSLLTVAYASQMPNDIWPSCGPHLPHSSIQLWHIWLS